MATHFQSFKFRLYPTPSQERYLARLFGACRWVYNHFLEQRKSDYEKTGKNNNHYADAKLLNVLKKQTDTKWLSELGSHIIRTPLENLDAAFKNMFQGRAKYPKFKSKFDRYQSVKIPDSFYIKNGKLILPKLKKSGIKLSINRELPAKIISCNISKNPAGEYYASFVCESETKLLPQSNKVIGIDLGLKSLLITSDGQTVENPKFYRKAEKELKYLQRQLAKKEGKTNKEKVRLELAKLNQWIANSRKDYLHKTTRKLIDENQVIIAESLSIKNMVKNHKLAKSISDVGWSEICRQLKYKAEWYGRVFYQIGQWFPSSKTCYRCKHIWQAQTLKDREWDCPNCGEHLDRDVNAAQNIRDEGLSQIVKSLVEEYQSDSKPKFAEPSCSKARRRSKAQTQGL